MNNAKRKVEVNIMGKLYSVTCPQQQEENLIEAVSFLNGKMDDLKHKMKDLSYSDTTWNRDSLLAIIALNLSYELLKMNTTVSSKASEVENLIERIKSSFKQSDTGDTTQKISEISL